MSDERNRDGGQDADVVERLLEELAWGGDLDAAAGGPGGKRRREYLELVGLMGLGVEPIEPPPAIKERLMAEVAASATVVPAKQPAREPAAEVVAMPQSPSGAPSRRWTLPLAASLALALAGFSAYQAAQLAGQRTTIDELSQRLEEVEARTPTVAALRGQLAKMREQMAMVTGRGVEICALRPMAAESQLANSRGVLYVAADHQHWYLTIDRLTPSGEGRSYQLWFVPADGQPISAGTFDVGEGARVELSSDTMPTATRAVTVTLEPVGGSLQPTGPTVLHGDEVMAVL